MFDLWEDEEELLVPPQEQEATPTPELSLPEGKEVLLARAGGEEVYLLSTGKLEDLEEFSFLMAPKVLSQEAPYLYQLELRPLNAFLLRYMLKGLKVAVEDGLGDTLAATAQRVPQPRAFLTEDHSKIELVIPGLPPYRELVRITNGYPVANGKSWRVNIARVMDLQTLAAGMGTKLPKLKFSEEVQALTTEPVPSFDGTLNSLKRISPGVLNVVKANSQSYKAKKASAKTLTEKMEAFGITSLYKLLTHLPKRYIDKSQPQQLRDMVIDEPTTIVGKVIAISSLPKNMGVRFTVELDEKTSSAIDVAFWRQEWLRTKFPVGTEVVITGKFGIFMKKPQLNGSSIEEAKEAAMVPIMPIYRQSESRGITTSLLFSAQRELFSRIETIELPSYLQKPGRMNYSEAYKELHIPTTLEHRKTVLDSLAYLELLDMQLIIQEGKKQDAGKQGISLPKTVTNLQEEAIAALPFKLTGEQAKAVVKLNEKLADAAPSQTLLNADVGSGKTVLAQLAALRAVENGYQAVLMAPTDVLGRQLHSSFERLLKPLQAVHDLKIVYFTGGMKAKEKKELLAGIKSGETSIIVATQSALSTAVEYANLGMVIIDEQQKFGAEQRSRLLHSREDGAVPDLLMMTATPIPRSAAQVFYGDIDMILVGEKPAGRLPIITEWLPEHPNDLIAQSLHPLWSDIQREAEKGNQTFVITPMVKDSETVDAASVERTYKALKEDILSHLRVGYVHGQMKGDEQKEAMERFRNKEFDVMVASTVVEVGVDIPDATRVVILSADRLGASSLHQIRGRVGRNSKQSYCYLVSLGETESAQHRLGSLVEFENGFDIAKADLELRGEGQLFNSDQSGASEMLYASLATHGAWVEKAKAEALDILASPHREQALKEAAERLNAEERFV